MKMGVSKLTYPFFLLVIHCLLRVHNGFIQYLFNTLTIPLSLRYHSEPLPTKEERSVIEPSRLRTPLGKWIK